MITNKHLQNLNFPDFDSLLNLIYLLSIDNQTSKVELLLRSCSKKQLEYAYFYFKDLNQETDSNYRGLVLNSLIDLVFTVALNK